MSDTAARIERLIAVFDHVEGQVQFGDAKAAQLLSIDALLLAGLVLLAKDVRSDVTALTLMIGAVSMISVFASLLFLLIAVAPAQSLLRSRAGVTQNPLVRFMLGQREPPANRDFSIVHFAQIITIPLDEYVGRAKERTDAEFEVDLLQTIYGKSCWVAHKFRWLDNAVKSVILAVLLAALGSTVEMIHWAAG